MNSLNAMDFRFFKTASANLKIQPAPYHFQITRSSASERGVSFLELALTLPVIILLVFGFIDFGWTMHDLQVIAGSAREGARVAAAHARKTPPLFCGQNSLPPNGINCSDQSQLTINVNDPIDVAAKKAACTYLAGTTISADDWDVIPTVSSVTEDGTQIQLVKVVLEKKPGARRCLLCWDNLTSFIKYHRESTFALEGECQ